MDTSGKDIARQITVISAFCFMIIAAVVGTGALGGTPVQDLQDGALAADATYLAPASTAFSIWSAIYVGLLAYTVWQALPGQRGDARQRALGWWIALTMALNGLWLVTAQFATLPLTVLAIVLLLIVLSVTLRAAVVTAPPRGWTDRILIDGVTGLHLGWVTLATIANATALLTVVGPDSWEATASVWGVIVLVVVALLGIAIAAATRRLAPALALAWGLSWLAVGRLADAPSSPVIGYTAIVVAVLVLIAGAVFTVRGPATDRTPSRTRAAAA